MKPQNLKVEIENGIITKLEQIKDGVSITTDGTNTFYPHGFVYPGFSDSHGHITGLGITLNITRLENCKSAESCATLAFMKPSFRGSWIYGRGWNQEQWQTKTLPTAELLDSYFPDTPVYFVRVDGHSAWVNTKAMQLAGIGRSTKNPKGGEIVRDNANNPTGILLDNAMDLVFCRIPKFTKSQLKKMIQEALMNLKRSGLTHVHDMDLDPGLISVFKELDENNQLPLKISAFLKAQKDEWVNVISEPYFGKNFDIVGLKFYADGALGSRGAYLLNEYNDKPGYRGLLLIEKSTLIEKVTLGVQKGFHIATHAIGDSANKMVIKSYEYLRKHKIADENAVLRLEHAQILHQEDIRKIAENRIYCSVQPVHCLSDAVMARNRLGDRCSNSYLWKSLIKNGITICGGSDFPIESFDPLVGIDGFIRRVPFGEKDSWFEDERLSPSEAIEAYTINPKKMLALSESSYEISIGNKAELNVLDKNILQTRGNITTNVSILDTIC